MTTLEQIRAEIADLDDAEYEFEGYYKAVNDALQIIDKYAEQEPTDRIEYGTDGNAYKLRISNGKEFEQEPCDDAISRQAVLDGIEKLKQSPWATDKRGNGFEYLITEALDTVADLCVKQEPSVRPQEQTGHWKRISMDRYTTHAQYWYKCDKCGEHNLGNTNFCPNCGCRMVEPQESEVKDDGRRIPEEA